MKARYAVLLVMVAAFLAVLSQKALAGNPGQGGFPLLLPSGQFSFAVQGSIAICLNPTTFAEEACSTTGVLAVPLTQLQIGVLTEDGAAGDKCETSTEVLSDLPVGASPNPVVSANNHSADKITSYDPTTGIGTGTFIAYTGGTCNGAIFDSSGATQTANGTFTEVVTENGNKANVVITSVTNSTDSIGGVSLLGTEQRQGY
jgi:hypothetical protein